MVTPETPKDTSAPLSGDLAKMVESNAAASQSKPVAPAVTAPASTTAPAVSIKSENRGEPVDRQEHDRQVRAAGQGVLNFGEISVAAVPNQDKIISSLPTNFKDWLLLFIQSPGLFVQIMEGVRQYMAATTFVGKEEGLHLITHEVCVILDRGVATVSFKLSSDASEEVLADELCSKMLAVPKLQSFGIQGSSGLQINRGEVLRLGWFFLQNILPLILPLLQKQ